MHLVKIISNIQIVPNTFILSVPRIFSFIPGQVVAITTSTDLPPRLYSIASANTDDELQILYTVKNEGLLTPKLSNLKTNDNIFLSDPQGKFQSTTEAATWIATGTGIAPFLSMLLSGNTANKTLIHGARYLSGFYFDSVFEKHISNYIKCCTGEESENSFKGRVTDYISEMQSVQTNRMYYLCGSAEMVVETRDLLIRKGVSFKNITSEIYF